MANNNFIEEIQNLISSKKTGEYWDFKQQHHSNKANLLHDVLCMANSLHIGNKYIIIGIEDKTFTVIGVTKSKKQSYLNVFLNEITFAGNIKPEVELRHVAINCKYIIDVLVIFDNKTKKPYFLSNDYKCGNITIRAGVIYSRIENNNTPTNSTKNYII